MASGREAQPAPQGGGGPQHPFGSRISPAPFPPAAPAPPVVSPAPALSAGGADPPNCPTCLEPLRPADPPRQRPAFWPGCRYPYHFACLARTVARLPDPACSLCRAPWPEGAAPELVDACTALAVNPFLDSDAGSRPPTPRANAAHAAPAVPVDSSSGSDSDAPCPPEPLPQPLPWARRGPPLCPVQGPANSWLYVPLLWAAVGDVPADALAAWRAATLTDDWWENQPRPTRSVRPCFPCTAHGCPRAAAARLPSAAQAHLPWAVRHLAGPDGYLEAADQEVCLQLYGGLADRFRASAVPEQAGAVPPARRRPRRRRDPPLPSNSSAAPSVPVPASDDEADEEALDLLPVAVTRLAAADLPTSALAALRLARLTALQKPDGGVRGIAAGDAFRRLASPCPRATLRWHFRLARPPVPVCPPGTCWHGRTRWPPAGFPGNRPRHRRRQHRRPRRLWYGQQGHSPQPSLRPGPFLVAVRPSFLWQHIHLPVARWVRRTAHLGTGRRARARRQPHPGAVRPSPAPCPCSSGAGAASHRLLPAPWPPSWMTSTSFAPRQKRAVAYNTVTRAVAAHAGVSTNQGKTRIYVSLPQAAPANLAELGPAVWCSDREPAARGFVAVGTPLGSPEYIAAHLEARLQEHQHLLDELPQLPDLGHHALRDSPRHGHCWRPRSAPWRT